MSELLNSLKLLLVAVSVGYLLLLLLLYFNQRNYLYFPTPEITGHGYAELSLQVEGASLKILQINPGQREAIIYFGGNGEAVAYNGPDYQRQFPGKTTYLVNYRGYGGSSGTPSEQALYRDALAIYDRVAPAHSAVQVVGRSIGSGIATYLAVNRPIEKLVLVTPFDSIAQVARGHYPYVPVSLLLKEKYDSIGRAASIQARTLILAAGRDRVIPPRHAQGLAEAIPPERLTLTVIDQAGHNDISSYPDYYPKLREFLTR